MKRKVVLFLVAFALSLGTPIVPAQAAVPPQETPSHIHRNPGTITSLFSFWTPERLEAAQPPPTSERTASGPSATQRTALADGPAKAVAGYGPSGSPTAVVDLTIPNSSSETPALTYPFPFNRVGLFTTMYAHFPWRTPGRVFFTNAAYGVGTFSCSGTTVTSGPSGNQNLVLTAGHCLNSGGDGVNPGTWSDNILFIPAYLNGVGRYGDWDWSAVAVAPDWNSDANYRFDYGFIVTAPNTCGDLAACTGAQGVAWNQPVYQQWWNIAYPSLGPPGGMDGNIVFFCTAPTAELDSLDLSPTGPVPLGMGCDFTGGSSGGAWVLGMRMANFGYANSVNSYKYTQPNRPKAVYGPYFDSNFGALWDQARVITP